jgi:ABC-type amino acid transport substrate-binding protein
MNNLLKSILLSIVVLAQPSFSAEQVIVAISGVQENSQTFKNSKALLQLIEKKMGVEITLKILPPKRAEMMLKVGAIHAELFRTVSYNLSNPEAIKVKEPITQSPLYAYTTIKNSNITDWESLRPYKIVTIRGFSFVNNYLSDHDTHAVNTIEQAVRFLLAKKADVFVSDPYLISKTLQLLKQEATSIHKVFSPIATFKLHTYFSSNFPEQAKRFSRALTEVKKENVYLGINLRIQKD